MFKVLLHLGLIATPVFFLPGHDVRDWKMKAALVFAAALGAVGLYSTGIGIKNKWLVALLAYIPLSIIIAPPPVIKLVGLDVGSFWSWEPFLQICLFMMMAGAIAKHHFEHYEIEDVLRTMLYIAVATSAYMILQYFMIDQFFKPIESFIPGRGHVAGFIGNPTLTAPFAAMMIPIGLYLRRYWYVAIIVLAVIATKSQVAIGAMCLSTIIYMASKGWRQTVLAILIIIGGAGYIAANPGIVQDQQRFEMWCLIAADIKNPIAEGTEAAYPLTGRGLGSFKYVFHQQHPGTEQEPNRFVQAHNEYIEFTYSLGIIGTLLLLGAIFHMFKRNFSPRHYFKSWQDSRKTALLCSFFCIAICAGGTFVWQIGTTAFFTVVLVGLLHNESL